ncbi:MAG: flippase-like domain-containing protein, partial [Bacteroidales bacterium]|nr:flippase-like domain-containing protein [Bacteroidales bacterium]
MKKIIYYTIPIVIFAYIFYKIDIATFKEVWKNINLYYLLMGLVVAIFTMILGSFRWIALSGVNDKKKYLLYFIKHYWMGHSMGVFMPASIGWDVYRVLTAGKQFGNYAHQVLLILLEKFVTLLNVFILVICLYPFINIINHKETLNELYSYTISIFAILLGLSILFIRAKKINFMNIVYNKILQVVKNQIEKSKKIKKIQFSEIKDDIQNVFNKRNTIIAFTFSLLLAANAALAANYFFATLNYEINYMVNLFVVPLLMLIFLLPISLGGLGVREVAFIAIYHIFGVPVEVALA